MRQLMYTKPGSCEWQEVPEPTVTDPGQALVRPLVVACCDLDIAVAEGTAPLPPGYAVGHEGVAEVIAVGEAVKTVKPGDRVVVPYQISCGNCRECRRGVSGACTSVPARAMYGLGSLSGLDAGGLMADLVLVPYADAMLLPVPAGVDLVSIASLSDNIPDGWRTVGPFKSELAALEPIDRRVLVIGGQSIGLYAAAFAAALNAHVDYLDTDPGRLAIAEKLGASVHDGDLLDKNAGLYPVTVSTAADAGLLTAALRATWSYGVCTDTGIHSNPVEMPMLELFARGIRFITGRSNARSLLPETLELLANGANLAPVVDAVVAWEDAPTAWPTMRSKTVFSRPA